MSTAVVWPTGQCVARSEQLIRDSKNILDASRELREESHRLRALGRALKWRRDPKEPVPSGLK